MSPTALIIEDDEDMGTIFAAAMQQAGYETEVIADGRAALSRLQEIVPDMVVLDLHLPGVRRQSNLELHRRYGWRGWSRWRCLSSHGAH